VISGSITASSPDLGVVLPRGGQRGTDVVLNFQGARLGDALEVLCYSPGFKFHALEFVNPNHVKAKVTIAPDCALGEHSFRLRCSSGISTLRTFWVGTLPVVEEVEPNNEFTKPQKIPLNCTVQGVINAEDVDYFAVEAKKNQRISVEIEGMRLGTAFFDPAIAILDPKRFELASSDDVPFLTQDGCMSILAPANGIYTIRVRESAYGGTASCHYRLHVGTFPRPQAVYPLGGRPGEEIEFTFIGDPKGDFKRKIKLQSEATLSRVPLYFDDAEGAGPSPLSIRVTDLVNVMEVEPNNAPNQATVGQVPCAFNGIIGTAGDHDHFKFAAKKGQVFDIRCLARKMGSQLDPVMWIAEAGGKYLTGSDDAENSPDSYFRFTVPEDKEYVIGIRDHLFKGGPAFVYRIEVTPIEPRVFVQLNKYGQPPTQERQEIPVPRGNRFAVLANVTRADFGGEVEVSAEGLPNGMTVQAAKASPGMTQVPLLFEAKNNAPIVGALGTLTAKSIDSNQKLAGRFFQTIELVYGFNNNLFAQTRVDRLATAVTDEVPFLIRIVEPKAPLVRNGVMYLKVIAERKGDYKAAIAIQPLYNPPGVAANTVVIPEGVNEIALTLTANGGAALGKFPYILMAQAQVKDGPVWISSPFANLEVAAPPVTIAFERAAAEQGKPTELRGKISVAAPFTGQAKVQMVGLPAKVTAQPVDIAPDSKDLAIPLTLDAASPAGQHKNLICQVSLVQNGEPVVYTAGLGELRIDQPLPPKANQPQSKVAAAPEQKPPEQKRLSRLEQLRKEQQEREKGSNPQ